MPAVSLKPDSPAVRQYYQMLREAEGQDALHEGNVRRAFETLLRETAKPVTGWELVTEVSQRRETHAVRYDGVLKDSWTLEHGYWEAKDTRDDLDTEIRKKIARGYPLKNIIFEDTRTGVLFQDEREVFRANLRQPEQLIDLLHRFYSYRLPVIEKFTEAVATFQDRIPEIALDLKTRIAEGHAGNRRFQTAYAAFMELCKTALNPNISPAAVDEMLIQHMLTERLIRKVFNVDEFVRRNVIAAEVENVIDALASQHFNRREFLGRLDYFYSAIESVAETKGTFAEKQDFLNHVYERFFQGYSVKVADTHGIVYTPQPIVDFMCAAVEEVLLTEFGKKLGDEGVCLIDPCTGTGNFVVNLLRRAAERNPRGLEDFYRQRLFANEVMLMPYYIASLNIEHEYFALTGRYEPFEGVCFVDTLDLAEGAQMQLSFVTAKNTARVERQKQAPITVIIGNPPYNVGQENENDNNKNRKYKIIDSRVKETYARDSNATSVTKINDPYVKFFRWAADRLQERDGIVCYVSNNSFVDQISFDGMRKHLLQDFTQVYHLDLHGNVRQNPKLSGTTHNVFGIQVGVGITVAVRSAAHAQRRLFYHRVPEFWTRAEKVAWLDDNVERAGRQNALNTVTWRELTPDAKHTWLVPDNADEYEGYLPIGSKEIKNLKQLTQDEAAIFKTYSLGVATNRDEMVYSFSAQRLQSQVETFIDIYNSTVDKAKRRTETTTLDNLINTDDPRIKWTRQVKNSLQRLHYSPEFNMSNIRQSTYRPFTRKYLYYSAFWNEEPRLFATIFPIPASEQENRVLVMSDIGYRASQHSVLISNAIVDLHFCAAIDAHQCFPFYVYDEDGGNRRENITDWALAQFRARYETLNPSPSPSGRREEEGVQGNLRPPQEEGEEGNPRHPQGEGKLERKNAPPPSASPLPEGEGQGVRVSPEGEGLGVRVADEAVYRARAAEVMTQIARELRQRQTPAEDIVWACLRNRSLGGMKFRRQHPIENTAYVVDFLCYEARLVIELDGGIHAAQAEMDALRQAAIEAQGYRVLRFANERIQSDLETVLTEILRTLNPQPLPLPHQGEGEQEGEEVRSLEVPLPDANAEGFRVRVASPLPDANAEGFRVRAAGGAALTPSDSPRPEGEGAGVRVEEGQGVRVSPITKWDIFYYVYALLHHPDYRERYAANLKRELPRIPFAPQFWPFAQAGRALADLHLNYESVKPYPLEWVTTPGKPLSFRVEKMRLSKEKDALVVNDSLTLRGIPAAAFEYRLGNRSALEWVIDQYQVSTDKRSGITSDPNAYSEDERYIVTLVERVVTVSVETVKIVAGLKALPFRD